MDNNEQIKAKKAFQAWMEMIRVNHPFTKMTKGEIFQELRQTRDAAWAEQQEDSSANRDSNFDKVGISPKS